MRTKYLIWQNGEKTKQGPGVGGERNGVGLHFQGGDKTRKDPKDEGEGEGGLPG